jgi:hypothetical protein
MPKCTIFLLIFVPKQKINFSVYTNTTKMYFTGLNTTSSTNNLRIGNESSTNIATFQKEPKPCSEWFCGDWA